jgi:HlyD family secretion protein
MNQYTIPDQKEIEAAIGVSPAARRKRTVRRLLWPLLALMLIASGVYAYRANQAVSGAVSYETVPAVTRDLTVTVSATGTIEPLTQVDVGSEMSGVIRDVLVDDNSLVKRGDILARLDTTRLEAQRTRANAQLIAAQSRLADAEAAKAERVLIANRQAQLRKQRLSTEQEFEAAQAALTRADATIASAKAEIDIAKADLALVDADIAKAELVSPIDGIVLKRSVEPGQTVAASFQAPVLFTLAQDLKRIQLEADVDEADVGVVKTGQSATFSVDAYRGRNFPATIERMTFAPETVDSVVTYKTTLSAENEDLSLRPGMTATAKITVAQFENVLTIPNEVLRYVPPRQSQSEGFSITRIFMPRFPRNEKGTRAENADGTRSIYLLRDGAPIEIKVKTGDTDGKVTIIREGDVKDGDQLITGVRQPKN